MNGLPYYKAYPRDFIEGTIGMDFETKCAYRVVIDLIYMQNGNLPDDARYISGLLGCSIRKWKTIREELIRIDKIQVSGEFLTNYRAVSELETLSKHQDKQRENRSRPNKNKNLKTPTFNHSRDYTEPEPDKKEKETPKGVPKKKVKRGTRLSEEWKLSAAEKQFAIDNGLTSQAIGIEEQKFRNYWLGKAGAGATKLDWPATWRNWVLNSLNYSRPPPRGSPAAERPDSLMGAIRSTGFGRSDDGEDGNGTDSCGNVEQFPVPAGYRLSSNS